MQTEKLREGNCCFVLCEFYCHFVPEYCSAQSIDDMILCCCPYFTNKELEHLKG